jgi:cobyrinic acid a,c-diamide synthase
MTYLLPARWAPAAGVLDEQVTGSDLARTTTSRLHIQKLSSCKILGILLADVAGTIPERFLGLGVEVVRKSLAVRQSNFPDLQLQDQECVLLQNAGTYFGHGDCKAKL